MGSQGAVKVSQVPALGLGLVFGALGGRREAVVEGVLGGAIVVVVVVVVTGVLLVADGDGVPGRTADEVKKGVGEGSAEDDFTDWSGAVVGLTEGLGAGVMGDTVEGVMEGVGAGVMGRVGESVEGISVEEVDIEEGVTEGVRNVVMGSSVEGLGVLVKEGVREGIIEDWVLGGEEDGVTEGDNGGNLGVTVEGVITEVVGEMVMGGSAEVVVEGIGVLFVTRSCTVLSDPVSV